MRPYLLGLCILMTVLWSSCRKDFEYDRSNGSLEFSRDTVFLDTVFTNIGSSTYSLKVYNRGSTDIEIPSINLAQGQSSSYRLNVDGLAGKEFENIPILAKDSIFIFIETTFDINPINENEFLYTDAIVFDSGQNQQEVNLVTLIKDAIFLFPSELADGSKETLLLGLDEEGNEIRIEGFVLEDNQLNFSNEKPYVIYGYAAVADGKTLSIDAGARLHFHEDSGLLVGSGGSLKVNGTLSMDQEAKESEVIFEGDRLEPDFDEVPGQWGTIWLANGSIANDINYLTLKNASLGILVEGNPESAVPTLTIKNSQLYNCTSINLWGRNTAISAENLVLGNSGIASLRCSLGGSYDFKHTTIANYWSNGFRTGATVELSNMETSNSGEQKAEDLIQANFTNCIVDGNMAIELFLEDNGSNSFNFLFTNCHLKFRDTNMQFSSIALYDFTNEMYYKNILFNEKVEFLSTANNDFRISLNSAVLSLGDLTTAMLVPMDLLGIDRTIEPDLGAFQRTSEE